MSRVNLSVPGSPRDILPESGAKGDRRHHLEGAEQSLDLPGQEGRPRGLRCARRLLYDPSKLDEAVPHRAARRRFRGLHDGEEERPKGRDLHDSLHDPATLGLVEPIEEIPGQHHVVVSRAVGLQILQRAYQLVAPRWLGHQLRETDPTGEPTEEPQPSALGRTEVEDGVPTVGVE